MPSKLRTYLASKTFPVRDPALRASPFKRDKTVPDQIITEKFTDPVATTTSLAKGRSLRGRTVKSPGIANRLSFMQIDPQSIAAYYEYAADFAEMPERVNWAMDMVIRTQALMALGLTQKRALGPVDPQMKNIAAAWKIPVRRITGMYFAGWTVQHLGLGIYRLLNRSREAYFIEFGINHIGTGAASSAGPVRIRRPVMKLSILQAIRIVQESGFSAGEVRQAVMPAGIYQSPKITGAYRPRGPSGSAAGLVDLEALASIAGGGAA